jgi:Protein of unknown function (DUF1194)
MTARQIGRSAASKDLKARPVRGSNLMLVGLTKRLALGSILLTTTTALFVTVILAVSVPTVWAADQVDLLLVLAADVSYSIAGEQFKLQREGYAQAITSPRVIHVIQSGEIGRIGVCYIEWSGEIFQTAVADWTMIGSVRDARQFANRIVEARSPKILPSVRRSFLQPRGSRALLSDPSVKSSIYPGTATTMLAVASPRHGTRRSPRA